MVVVDLQLSAFLIDVVYSSLVVPVYGDGGKITEVELNDVVVHSGDYLKVIDGNGFFEVDELIIFPCSFAHLFHFEEGVLGDEEGFEVEEKEKVVVLLAVIGNLLFGGFLSFLDGVEVLLSEFKDIVGVIILVEATYDAIGEEISKTILVFEALPDEDELTAW